MTPDAGTNIAGLEFDFTKARFALTMNTELQVANGVVHNPSFATAENDVSRPVTFILLDEALGEDRTELWTGTVDRSS